MTTSQVSKSSCLARWLLSQLGEVADLRGIGEQLAVGRRNAVDTVLIMSITDAVTFIEGADDMVNGIAKGSA